jgi:hypothetical protein
VAVGDFDGDGNQDLATADFSAATVSILLGQGNGSFTSNGSFFGTASFMTVGDFDDDGNQDLAVGTQVLDSVSILLGQGDGSFTNIGFFLIAGSSPRSVAVGDFDGDGNQDLATADGSSDSVSILLGQGNGSFTSNGSFGVGSSPRSVVVGDFDGDGRQDLATANSAANSVSILLSQGNGSFTSGGSFGVGNSPQFVTVGDFDDDGNKDLVIAAAGPPPSFNLDGVSILLNQLDAWVHLGSGLAGVTGTPILAGTGTLELGSAGDLTLSNAAPSAAAMVFVSLTSTPAPFKCGTLVPVPILNSVLLQTDVTGALVLAWPSWPVNLFGQSLHLQYAVQDAAAVCGASLSNALRKKAGAPQ